MPERGPDSKRVRLTADQIRWILLALVLLAAIVAAEAAFLYFHGPSTAGT